jgi:5'-nucleotidase
VLATCQPDDSSPAVCPPVTWCHYVEMMRIVVTNDDGIDSVGLHQLAAAMLRFGEVVIVAPDSEYSGAGAAVGALHLIRPEVHKVATPVPGAQAWSVDGPPALCVMFARLGVFGGVPDLVVSGINPGANVGRAVYHSGTIGAALTARSGRISGIAVSQDVAGGGIDGQSMDEMLALQKWESAAAIAAIVVEGFLANPPEAPVVLNVNVPNLDLGDIKGWRYTEVAAIPPRTLTSATLEPKDGHADAYRVTMHYGEAVILPIETDGGAVTAGYVSICALSKLSAEPLDAGLTAVLDRSIPNV